MAQNNSANDVSQQFQRVTLTDAEQEIAELRKALAEERKAREEKEKALAEEQKARAEEARQLNEAREKIKHLERVVEHEKALRRELFDLPAGLVPSVSAVAKNPKQRNEYYQKILRRRPVRGGFVAYSMFIRFVKGANGDLTNRDKALGLFKRRAEKLVKALEERSDHSFLAENGKELESPQSLVASQLLSMALDTWRHVLGKADGGFDDDNPLVLVSHQGEIKRDYIPQGIDILFGGTKVEYKVDVMACVISEGMMKIISTLEYKPEDRTDVVREAQRDMYATNTISLHRRLCIGVDIAGGNNVAKWKITAMAYFGSPEKIGAPLFECSEMYQGEGLEALFSIAVGIHEAAKGWTDETHENEFRLGPVVALHGNQVHKVYHDAKYRKPNLDIVKKMVDNEASEWKSRDGKIVILSMRYIKSQWNGCDVPAKVFLDIVQKLSVLHRDGKVHGDIRLANLLNSDNTGFIIDFDFVGRTSYPEGLKMLSMDGGRHPEVNDAIEGKTVSIGNLEMKKEHDVYSLGEVMRLFKCKKELDQKIWDAVIGECHKGCSIEEVAKHLEGAAFSVRLRLEELKQLFETGPTPRKGDGRYSASNSLSMMSIKEDSETT